MKLLILFCLTILQQSSIFFCYDIELEGRFNFGNDFVKKLQKAAMETNVHQLRSNDKDLAEKHKSGNVKLTDETLTYTTDNNVKINESKPTDLAHERKLIHNIKKQMIKEGKIKLKSLAYKIIKNLNVTFEIHSIVEKFSVEYATDINEHINYIGKQHVNNEIEREFYILDLIESSNKFFSQKAKEVLKSIIARLTHNVPRNQDKILLKLMHEVIVEEKKHNLNYVCEKLHICRYFPSYTDHIVIILREILKLSDERVEIIVKQFKDIIENNMTKFINTIMADETNEIISLRLNRVVEHVADARSFLTLLQKVISQRFTTYRSVDGEIKIRKKAVRILIDMIDKALELGNDRIDTEFDVVLNGLKSWSKDLPSNNRFKSILTNYCKNFGDVLRSFWSSDTKEEAKVLVEVIATGRSNYGIQSFDDLFSKGSKFVREIEF